MASKRGETETMRNVQLSTLNAQRSTTLPLEPGAQYSALNVGRYVLSVLALFFLTALPAPADRDPFWPIGYTPPKPEPAVKETPELLKTEPAPAKPKPPAIKPVSEKDWADAHNSIIVSGFTRSSLPGTGKTRTLVMINRRSYAPGDTLCLTNAEIRFLWRVESVADLNLRLSPVKAERLTASPLPNDLKTSP